MKLIAVRLPLRPEASYLGQKSSEAKCFQRILSLLPERARLWRRYTGSFSDVSAIDLGAHARKKRFGARVSTLPRFDHAIFGNVLQTSADAIYGARHVALKAGLPIDTPAVTVNRLCGSGIEAIVQAAQQIVAGRSEYGAGWRDGKYDAGPVCYPRSSHWLEIGWRRAWKIFFLWV